MVARNEDLPEEEFSLRHARWRAVKVRGETLQAVRQLAARHNETQAEYIGRAFRLLLRIESSLVGADPLAYLEEKFLDSA